MSINNNFSSSLFSHSDRIHRGLDLTSKRAENIFCNISNINTQNYKRKDSSFYEEEDKAFKGMQFKGHKSELTSVVDSTNDMRIDGNSVDLEHEVNALKKTEERAMALTEILKRDFSRMRSAIRLGE